MSTVTHLEDLFFALQSQVPQWGIVADAKHEIRYAIHALESVGDGSRYAHEVANVLKPFHGDTIDLGGYRVLSGRLREVRKRIASI